MIRDRLFEPEKISDVLSQYLSEERAEKLRTVVDARTRSVATVVEGVSNYGNVSAVMRTAEALGFLEVHVVTGDQPYKHSRRTSQGAEKWLDIRVWDEPAACIADLRGRGYQIALTDAGSDSEPLSAVDFGRKTAVVLGNELEGVSPAMRAHADIVCRIDLKGFVESYNISVAAALILYHAYSARVRDLGKNGDLPTGEKAMLEAQYRLRAVQRAPEVVLEHVRRSEKMAQSSEPRLS